MARNFNGTTDLIDAGTTVGAITTSGQTLSMSAWFNPSTFTFPNSNGAYAAISGRNTSTSGGNYIVYLKSTGKIGWYANAVNVDPGTNAIPGINTWNNIVLALTTTSAAGLNGYLNGVLDASLSTIGSVTNPQAGAHFQIGADGINAATFEFPGRIADVAVWNIILTAAEALALSKGARPNTIRSSALVGWWPLDGLQSPEPDLSGGVFNGTLTGTALATTAPPLMMFTPRWPQFLTPPAGVTFSPAWAAGKNIVVEGVAT